MAIVTVRGAYDSSKVSLPSDEVGLAFAALRAQAETIADACADEDGMGPANILAALIEAAEARMQNLISVLVNDIADGRGRVFVEHHLLDKPWLYKPEILKVLVVEDIDGKEQ